MQGFRFEAINNENVVINGIPTMVKEGQITAIFEELLDAVKHEVPESSFSQLDIISKSLANSLAIKNGTKLTTQEQEEILQQLFSCKEPNHSPYGKNTFITLPLDEIELKFNN